MRQPEGVEIAGQPLNAYLTGPEPTAYGMPYPRIVPHSKQAIELPGPRDVFGIRP